MAASMSPNFCSKFFSCFLKYRKIIDHTFRYTRNINHQFCKFKPGIESHVKVKRSNNSQTKVTSLIGLVGAARCISLFRAKEENEVKSYIEKAHSAMVQGDMKLAESLYHDALKAADERRQQNKSSELEHVQEKIYVYDGLADLAMSQGNYENAEKLYTETMKGYLQTGKKQTDNAMVELSIKLAVIYAMGNRDSEAVTGYEFAIKTQEEKLREDPNSDNDTKALLGLALESYGRYKLLHKEMDKAISMLLKAVDIATSVMGRSHPQTLILFNDIATAYIMKGDYAPAEKYIKETIAIAEEAKIPEVSTFYCNLGSLLLRMSKLEEAQYSCEIALKKSKRFQDVYGAQHAKECLSKIRQVKLEEKNK